MDARFRDGKDKLYKAQSGKSTYNCPSNYHLNAFNDVLVH